MRDRFTFPTAIVLLAFIGLLDYLTGWDLSFAIFYLGPVAFAAWFGSRWVAVATAVAGAVFWLLADILSPHAYATPFIPLWNASVRLGTFLTLALALNSLRRTLDRLQATDADRNALLGVVSHDLRNLLTLVNLNAEIALKASEQKGGKVPGLQGIREAGTRMERLIADLLSFAGITRGNMELDVTVCSTDTLLDALETLGAPLAASQGKTLSIRRPSDDLPLACDVPRIEQVLLNLLGNAIKFTPSGGSIEVSTSVAHGTIAFHVDDEGPGIASEKLPHIFEAYWKDTAAREAGTGLGLFIAQTIARAHGGEITVASRLGKGARFTLELPRGIREAKVGEIRPDSLRRGDEDLRESTRRATKKSSSARTRPRT